MNMKMRDHKLLTQIPGELEHAIKSRCKKDCTLGEITNTLQEVWIGKSIGRYDNNRTGANRYNPTLERKEAHYPAELEKTRTCHRCGSPNQYEDNCPKDRKQIFPREEETRKYQEGYEYCRDSMGNGFRDSHTVNQPPMISILCNLRTMIQ
ncbi:hypothetical protein O181_049924 [Austropuccinia psidii MF-1]|uniref:Uncharacterized protein n=1 Tax=Austropuccinia psidii MF-1 TaxID=1389203 RepID=A0A9Q3DVV8_9BASI|nr:hypothetical protein [Austropuccinia psidii MF-1]